MVTRPIGHGRKDFRARHLGVRPPLEANRWAYPPPAEAAIRDQAIGNAYCLAGREIEIVRMDGDLSSTYPELQQCRVNIDQRRATKARQELGIESITEI